MGRSPCCDKQGLKKGPWTPEEDKVLVDYIEAHGHGSWRSLPKLAGLLRCGKSCRLRWTNYLRPDIKRGPFTAEEQKSILQLHGIVGNKWSAIAAQLPGRTDNEIKNYWNTHLKKRLVRMGLNPDTYNPASATRHMAQWESARLEAEARLSRESLLFSPASVPNDGTDLNPKQEPDIFLRMWNSEVGDSFRKSVTVSGHQPTKPEVSSPESGERREEVESKSCVSGGVAAVDSSSSNEIEGGSGSEETYELYLDFAGDELSMFHGQLESFPLFSGDLNEASLDTAFK